ncbi:hypothetical protein KSS87_003257, partial [Heliosperma pusillum]
RSGKDVDVPVPVPAPFILRSPVSGFSSSRSWIVRVPLFSSFIPFLFNSSFICQSLEARGTWTIALPSSEPYDFIRTSRMAGYGLLILGPTLHYWFNFMSKIFPGRDLLPTAKKMALGQTVYGPFMNVIFFSLNAALQGLAVAETTLKGLGIRRKNLLFVLLLAK